MPVPYIGLFDLFRVGIGPSSSHTVGPMRAAFDFASNIEGAVQEPAAWRIVCDLYGSLALTGKGHATDTAVVLGLLGEQPDRVDPGAIAGILSRVAESAVLKIGPAGIVRFNPSTDIVFRKSEFLQQHPNALTFTLFRDNQPIVETTYFSVGGGFIETKGREQQAPGVFQDVPYQFSSAQELLSICRQERLSLAGIIKKNETALHGEEKVLARISTIWAVMSSCIERGLMTEGILPGGLNVKRRAPALFNQLSSKEEDDRDDPVRGMDWVSLYALAVNEENAAGGRVVTSPTNGAAGIVPAVLQYYYRFSRSATDRGIEDFFLAATAIGSIIKRNASISGADVGCQGEVGSASAMAAGGFAAALGGSNEQIENAAEIALEHSLGLTCDPVGGLVQIPCIERNAIGAVKAITAARLALNGDGVHRVSLDQAIETMRQTGKDMMSKYKETALGGLAVNVADC